MYEDNKLQTILKALDGIEENDDVSSLTNDEKVLMKLLEKMA